MSCRVRFSVLAFVNKSTKIALVGSCKELGEWNVQKSLPMTCSNQNRSSLKSSFWSVVVDLEESLSTETGERVEYKFIRWTEVDSVTPETELPDDHIVLPGSNSLEYIQDGSLVFPHDATLNPPLDRSDVGWEGVAGGNGANRVLFFSSQEEDQMENQNPDSNVYALSKTDFLSEQNEFCLPPVNFRCPSGTSEPELTTKYYRQYKAKNDIDFDWVWPKILVGTTPRRLTHIRMLKSKYNVHSVLNLQSPEDIIENWPLIDSHPNVNDRHRTTLRTVYAAEGLGFVNVPTIDLCSSSRIDVVADASLLLDGLLKGCPEDGVVYVHCNAGVGRAIACVCSYLINIKKLALRQVNLLVCMRRPVAYFDRSAMRSGQIDFDLKYQEKDD